MKLKWKPKRELVLPALCFLIGSGLAAMSFWGESDSSDTGRAQDWGVTEQIVQVQRADS